MEWSLAPGPAYRITGGYGSALAGQPAGRLRLEISSALPGKGPALISGAALVVDPHGWRSWSADVPARDAPSTLRITWSNSGPAGLHSLFLNEPSLSARRRRPGRTIILLVVDTLRADHVSGYGYARATTPTLDRFFDGWLRAPICLPAANWTLPSHASLFTSTTVARHGVGRYGHLLPEDLATLPESLGRAGFRTLAVTGGGFVDPSFGFARGFDRYAVVPGRFGKAVESALAMLEEHRGEPVFLFLHTYQVHDFAPDEQAARRLFSDPTDLGPRWQEDVAALRQERTMTDPRFPLWIRARYDAALRSVDGAFGELLEGLERQGRLEETAVLFTSDHGEALCDRNFRGNCLEWGHGSPYLFEEELRVPLQVRVPWRPDARGVVAGNASLLDVAPTLAVAAGIVPPSSFEGRSLLSRGVPPDRVLVTEAPPLDALALRQGSSKVVRRTGVAQRSLFDQSVFYSRFPAEECYDLAHDPAERISRPCEPGASARADRYIASSFPDALVIRVPPRPYGGGRVQATIRARGQRFAPAVRTFGLASPPELTQQGAVSRARFWVGVAPVWLAFEPGDGSRALEVEAGGLGLIATAGGGRLAPGSHRWSDLGWGAGRPLPDGVALFTTPPSVRSSSFPANLSGETAARLLSLGYLRGAPALSPRLGPAPGESEAGASSLSAGEVRILRAE
jgi:arylsulfatase A-like enzyme